YFPPALHESCRETGGPVDVPVPVMPGKGPHSRVLAWVLDRSDAANQENRIDRVDESSLGPTYSSKVPSSFSSCGAAFRPRARRAIFMQPASSRNINVWSSLQIAVTVEAKAAGVLKASSLVAPSTLRGRRGTTEVLKIPLP